MNEININEIRLELVQLGLLYIQLKRSIARNRKKIRRWWSKPNKRFNYLTGYGSFHSIFLYFKLNNEEDFILFTRCRVQSFEFLHNLIRERLIKRSRRPALPSRLRLCLTLNYLAYGDTINKNEWFYIIGRCTVYNVIEEVCTILCDTLMPLVMQFPSPEEFRAIAQGFSTDLHLPNCIGALDGRHCPINKPKNSGSLYYNYRKFFSVVLMAFCDSQKRFVWANVGDYGSFNDAGIFANSDLGQAIANGIANIPPPVPLPNTDIMFPHYLVCDGGFPLNSYMLKPYILSNNNLANAPQRIYNFRVSHARRVIECAFGLLTEKWRVNKSPIGMKVSTAEKIIMSSVCLHNLLIDIQLNEFGNRWRTAQVLQDNQNMPERNNVGGNQLRQILCNYFNSPEGHVPWQWQMI